MRNARMMTVLSLAALGIVVTPATQGCGSSATSEFGGDRSGNGPGGDNGAPGFGFGDDQGGDGTPGGCVGLQCQQVACASGGTTSLSGKVFDPSGTVPLYNAIVYVPNSQVEPLPKGLTCDQCGTLISGSPITTAITDAKGEFRLENVPVGDNIPVVIQIGKWRRQITVPSVASCQNTALAPALTRLPRNQSEGDLPQFAITTGGADSLECFLRKIGISDSEFTPASGNGRVHMFQGTGGSTISGITAAASLWDSPAELAKHDVVILSCEGNEYLDGKSDAAMQAMFDYANAGGRIFASHFHYVWFKDGRRANQKPSRFPKTANFISASNERNGDYNIDRGFPKGQALAEWLVNVGASQTVGQIPMREIRTNVSNVVESVSRRWIFTPNSQNTKYYSFNTPVGAPPDNQCGRAVYTDIHVSGTMQSGGNFPRQCSTDPLTPQEKALLFLLFDLSACISDDSKPPKAPPPR
jgi:hypothetical protein